MSSISDAVVVGGGVVGASIAFHLARLGAGKVTLLERSEQLAAGATGRSGALVRTHYTNEPEAAMAWAAVPWFEHWAERVGGSCGFMQTGFAQLVLPADDDLLRANVAMLQRVGVDTRLVEAADLQALEPALAVADVEIAAYEPRSGYADPVATTESLAAAAQRHGASVRLGEPVLSVQQQGSRVTGVVTAAGAIAADVVVLANGWWSKELLAGIGVDVPIDLYRAQRTLVERPDSLRGTRGHLTIIDRRYGIYARPHGTDATLVGLSSASQPSPLASGDPFDVDPGFPERARASLGAALPSFADSAVGASVAGPLDVTPDRCCILGTVEGVEGLQLAVGMSGGGFKKAPAVGACIAELVVHGRASTAPIEPFALDRFTRGAAIESTAYRVGGGPEDSRDALVH